jgi:hypothetical protein
VGYLLMGAPREELFRAICAAGSLIRPLVATFGGRAGGLVEGPAGAGVNGLGRGRRPLRGSGSGWIGFAGSGWPGAAGAAAVTLGCATAPPEPGNANRRSAGDRLHTGLCDMLGVSYPILQSGMGGVSGPELAAAVFAAGGLGIMAAAHLPPDEVRRRSTRSGVRPTGPSASTSCSTPGCGRPSTRPACRRGGDTALRRRAPPRRHPAGHEVAPVRAESAMMLQGRSEPLTCGTHVFMLPT